MATRKIPVAGFLVRCLKCGGGQVLVENRQDGTDFRCQKCGNKLLLRPGEALTIQIPKQKINEDVKRKAEEFRKKLDETPMDDWPSEVLDEYLKDHPTGEN